MPWPLLYRVLRVLSKLLLHVINQGLRHEGVWGSKYVDPGFLDLSTSWMYVVSFAPLPALPLGKEPSIHIP
jgi:hypothetical protein